MDEQLWRKAETFADRDYTVVISLEQSNAPSPLYMAKNPELIGCIAQGETLEEAIKNLRDARIDYIYDSLKNGSPIPEPRVPKAVTRYVQTGDNSTFVDVSRARFRIEKTIPADVPSEPIAPHIQQYVRA